MIFLLVHGSTPNQVNFDVTWDKAHRPDLHVILKVWGEAPIVGEQPVVWTSDTDGTAGPFDTVIDTKYFAYVARHDSGAPIASLSFIAS